MKPTQFERQLQSATHSIELRSFVAAGVPERVVRRSSRRTSYGYYAPDRNTSSPSTAQRILDAAPRVPPGGAVAGWAAAYVHGIDWLDGVDPFTLAPRPVGVVLGSAVGRGQHAGVRFVRHRLPAADVCDRYGISVTTPVRSAFDGIRLAAGLSEAVVVADAFLHFGAVQLDELRSYVVDHRGWAGIAQARRAVELADAAVLSTWESRLRTTYVVGAGLPRPLVNRQLHTVDGRVLGRPDLFDDEAALVVEFDGLTHRGREQHSYDNVREEDFESHGLTVVRVDSLALMRDVRGVVFRMRDGRRRGLARPRDLDRWRLASAR